MSAPSLDLSHKALAELGAALDPGHLIVDRELCAAFEHDITGRFGAAACAVARPADTAQVAAVVARLRRARDPPRAPGGQHGPRRRRRAARRRTHQFRSAACSSWATSTTPRRRSSSGRASPSKQLQRHARAAGLDVGIDHGARSAATIGGMAATNAGGAGDALYGTTMRAQVAGIEAVLASTGRSSGGSPACSRTTPGTTFLRC